MKKLVLALRIELIVVMLLICSMAFGSMRVLSQTQVFSVGFLNATLWVIIAIFYLSLILGRLVGVSNGIGGILIICATMWNAMASMHVYESLFMPEWFLSTLPTVFYG